MAESTVAAAIASMYRPRHGLHLEKWKSGRRPADWQRSQFHCAPAPSICAIADGEAGSEAHQGWAAAWHSDKTLGGDEMKPPFRLLRTTVAALFLAGCSPGPDVVRWTEEVQSHDGSVFLLEGRATRARPPIVLFERRGPVISNEYYHRASGAYWKSPGGGFFPGGFDLVDGVPYMVVPIGHEIVCIWFDFPENDMLIYRWENNGWRRARFAELPPGFDFNLLYGMFNERDRKRDVSGFVTLALKASRDGTRGGGIKGFLERRDGGTWCASHKARYEKLGRKPLEAFRTDEAPPQFEGSHGTPDADLMQPTKHN